jgi:hypothetical protein
MAKSFGMTLCDASDGKNMTGSVNLSGDNGAEFPLLPGIATSTSFPRIESYVVDSLY